ncbi:Hsp20 family protein [Pseudomonas sp. R2.Fl]|nr:Hsp20 family protein [Pseudomonas sp. R2.Fl]
MAGPKDQPSGATAIRLRTDLAFATGESRSGDGYPPYNVERLLGVSSHHIRITLAVAGFEESELDIQLTGDELTIRGRQAEKTGADYLFRGIAARQFQRIFKLAPGTDVLSARLGKGLLTIELRQPEPDQTVRKINISASQ